MINLTLFCTNKYYNYNVILIFKFMKKILALFFVSLLVSSCSVFNIPKSDEGIAYFKINFSNKSSFNIKAIPQTTDSIKITITGDGLDEPKVLELTKEENNVTVTKLPEGKKIIEVLALNSKKMTVAEAKSEVSIEKAKVKTVEIELKPTSIANIDPNSLIEKLNITLKNINNDMDSILQIKKDSFNLIKEFKGNKIEFNNIPSGTADIKVTSSKNGLPVFNFFGKVNIDKENIELTPETINYQTNYELQENQGIPTLLVDFLRRILIEKSDNNNPFIENIEITVNGEKKSFGLLRPICLNQNDKLKIAITATDKDNNDKLSYFWGITEPKDGNFIIPRYDMRLQQERNNILERDVNFKKGRIFIGFIITDKKSFINTTIPFLMSDTKCN